MYRHAVLGYYNVGKCKSRPTSQFGQIDLDDRDKQHKAKAGYWSSDSALIVV